jgi:hypothetical protein
MDLIYFLLSYTHDGNIVDETTDSIIRSGSAEFQPRGVVPIRVDGQLEIVSFPTLLIG